jgi:CIC family chloride channel protein
VNNDNIYFGIITLNDVRKLLFDVDKYNSVIIKDIMIKTPENIYTDDRMDKVMDKFVKTKAWNLPVIDHNNKYIGMVSQSTIFSSYRNEVLNQIEN